MLPPMGGRVRVRRLPSEVIALGCTVEPRQAGWGSVIGKVLMRNLGPAYHVELNFIWATI